MMEKEFFKNMQYWLKYLHFFKIMPKNMKIFRGPFRGQQTNIFFGAIHHKSPNFIGDKVVWVPVGLGGGAR